MEAFYPASLYRKRSRKWLGNRRGRSRSHYPNVERGHDSHRVHQPILPQPSRAGGGISGGGDTPTKTLWKYLDDGLYTIGEFQDGTLFVEGPDENQAFVIDETGRIEEYTRLSETYISLLKRQFAQYFGEIEDVKILIATGLSVGDDIPNWEDYKLLN